tara:strand:- start:9824 stop:10123 length:300 start_codon:yes stop_codon:yes gene_type:complete
MLDKIRIQEFRILALIEGISYLTFAVTMPLKYVYEITEPNYFVGMLHGLVFLLYCLWLLVLTLKKKWSWFEGILFFIASLIPFGTFYIDKRYLKTAIQK